ncbi:hypothetical protein C8J57DRAFT_1465030 [Mycena rebaudengoi]|nr:hypothetical protein C8J57DRAFT_1465030 [Mycena rebaudengoi]
MVHLNLTAIAAAAGLLNILDFQNSAVTNSLGLALNNNPVMGNTRGSPQWTLITTATPGVFTIQSTAGLFLSYPAAPNSGLTFGQAVLNKFPLRLTSSSSIPLPIPSSETQSTFPMRTCFIRTATDAHLPRIVEITSKVVLTSWPAEAGSTNSPLTFEVDTNRPEQIFTLTST